MAQYRKIIGTYGFDDFFGVGDLIDSGLGGYTFDGFTADRVDDAGCAGRARRCERRANRGFWRSISSIRMTSCTSIPICRVTSFKEKIHAIPIFPTPEDNLYQTRWDDLPLPVSRSQPLDAPGRPKAHAIYQSIQDMMVGQWPDEDRRWHVLRNYYYNCIRDCDQQVIACA